MQLVINCCGPFQLYGEPVVLACIEAGTHYVDITGEPLFIEQMQAKYHEMAHRKSSIVIPACGFDSIPADMGVLHLEKQFPGQVNSVECYMTTWVEEDTFEGAVINYGTWQSAVLAMANDDQLVQLRKKQKEDLDRPEVLPLLEKR